MADTAEDFDIEGVTRDGEVISLSPTMALRGRVLRVGWELPEDLSETEWQAAGEFLGKIERSVSWWIGDWWAFGERRYGERKTIVEAEDWEGPKFATCRWAASITKTFGRPNVFEDACKPRRRETLSFQHHAEVAALEAAEADSLLDWAEETIKEKGKPRSTRELRAEVHRRHQILGIIPNETTCAIQDLWTAVEQGRKWGCIYADPPWLYDNQGTRSATGNHYNGMTVDELCELPIGNLAADNAHLHLWTTNAFLFEAPRIFDAWGFEFRTTFIWLKGEVLNLPAGAVSQARIGIGNYWRNAHEIMLTGVRGDAKRFNDHTMPSWLACDRGEHSTKPDQVRAMIERGSPPPFLELFARQKTPRWDAWGNQIERNLFYAEAAQ